MTRIAISPRFAIRIFCSNLAPFDRPASAVSYGSMPDAAATWSPAPDLDAGSPARGSATIRWFAGIDSTNRYLLRVRARRVRPKAWSRSPTSRPRAGAGSAAPGPRAPGAALLVSVLLRPDLPPERLHLVTLAAAVARDRRRARRSPGSTRG